MIYQLRGGLSENRGVSCKPEINRGIGILLKTLVFKHQRMSKKRLVKKKEQWKAVTSNVQENLDPQLRDKLDPQGDEGSGTTLPKKKDPFLGMREFKKTSNVGTLPVLQMVNKRN